MIILWIGILIGFILIPIIWFSIFKLLFKNNPERNILTVLTGLLFSFVSILIINPHILFLIGHFRITVSVLLLLSGIALGNAFFYPSGSILKNSLKGLILVTTSSAFLFLLIIILIKKFKL